jgi:hypothetical protein
MFDSVKNQGDVTAQEVALISVYGCAHKRIGEDRALKSLIKPPGLDTYAGRGAKIHCYRTRLLRSGKANAERRCNRLRDGERQQPLPEKRRVTRYRTLMGPRFLLWTTGQGAVPNTNPRMGEN